VDLSDFSDTIGDVGSGLLGMVGANAQNQAAAGLQQQEENYNTQMANTSYQRGMADMKAAGLNPMLAYMEGGDSSPTAPLYQPSSPLSQATDAMSDLGSDFQNKKAKVTKAQGDASQATSNANSAETAAQTARATQPSAVNQAVAEASLAETKARVQNDTRISQTAASAADAKRKKADANSAEIEANVSKSGESARKNVAKVAPYVDVTSKAVGAASSALDAGNIYKALKKIAPKEEPWTSTRTGRIFNKNTGELHGNSY